MKQLRIENEFLLREHERIYENNRNFEGLFLRLIDEYNSIKNDYYKKRIIDKNFLSCNNSQNIYLDKMTSRSQKKSIQDKSINLSLNFPKQNSVIQRQIKKIQDAHES